MLHLQTILPDTLELLKKYPNYSIFRALLSLNYFDDAEPNAMPKMFIPTGWEEIKNAISAAVNSYQKR